ncbi:hypothetical protein [Gordonibacter massiliensis (ex Traore et al. 2017)]|uniref:hypothetical protein n=1 Tax=Gordonibacter massiliensis (ex Traore et al. 2017) TaxID=1841863 RepID=UPI001C8B2442|nr:hypothetical protein [Gordonibacter massiliensis (ex Traore et al. 2017)]MBX9033978.1 hypothetical protein [Gordonibacter massiliensis (ex Traore et al. 2017)]
MSQTLAMIGEDVSEIAKGQQNDRIGLYHAGLDLYLESKVIGDSNFRKLIAAQALKSLSDANAQMVEEIESHIRYLLEGKYNKKGNRTKAIRERLGNINKCFEVIHHSTVLKAAVYFEENEVPAMLATIDKYGNFLESTIVPNVTTLAEHDASDTLLTNGFWENRAKSLLVVEDIRNQLTGTNCFFLEAESETESGNNER